jgi:hypothetical protein
MWISIGIVVVAGAIAAILLLTRSSADGPYALTAWEYGAIAWGEPAPADRGERTAEAAHLFEEVFALWGLEPPEIIEDGRVARKGDPAGGPPVSLWALSLHGSLLPPLIVIVFPDMEAYTAATGREDGSLTLTYGVAPTSPFGQDSTVATIADWVVELTGSSVAFLCTGETWRDGFVCEAAQWMLERAMEIPELCECTPYGLPQLIRGGIAGYTASRVLDTDDRLDAARAWAAENGISTETQGDPLTFDVDDETLRILGTSFITYLIGDHDEEDLIAEICSWHSGSSRWCRMSTSRTLLHVRGWRAFLGLEEG